MLNIYLGVYGIYTKENHILMIKKARGPYKNQYDLPGGGIEFGETIEEALSREITEETGAILTKRNFVGNNEYMCEYTKENGERKKFHHIGFYYQVNLEYNTIKIEPDGQDSLGATRIPIVNLEKTEISPIAKKMILKCLSSI